MFSRMRHISICSIAAFAGAFAFEVSSKVPLLTIDEMVARSHYVVEAEVLGVRALDQQASIAILRVQKNLIGKAPDEIAIHHFPNLSVSATFSVNERCVFFVAQHQGKQVLVNGHAGKICKDGESTDFVNIAGLKHDISWNDLLSSLRDRGVTNRQNRGGQ